METPPWTACCAASERIGGDTSTASLTSRSELDKLLQISDKTRKRAAISGGRPLLEIGMLFQDRSGHLARIMIHAPLRTFDFGSELEYLCHAVQS
jgi:hypothetical protein